MNHRATASADDRGDRRRSRRCDSRRRHGHRCAYADRNRPSRSTAAPGRCRRRRESRTAMSARTRRLIPAYRPVPPVIVAVMRRPVGDALASKRAEYAIAAASVHTARPGADARAVVEPDDLARNAAAQAGPSQGDRTRELDHRGRPRLRSAALATAGGRPAALEGSPLAAWRWSCAREPTDSGARATPATSANARPTGRSLRGSCRTPVPSSPSGRAPRRSAAR